MNSETITEEEYESFKNLVERVLCFQGSTWLFNDLYDNALTKIGKTNIFRVENISKKERRIIGHYDGTCPELQTELILRYFGSLNPRKKYANDIVRIKLRDCTLLSVAKNPTSYNLEMSRSYDFLGADREVQNRIDSGFPNIEVLDKNTSTHKILEYFAMREELRIVSKNGLEVRKYI
ncbi:MAG: hypothetical protein WAU65_02190 [Candidatus Nanoarchaeia archaeon]